MTAAGVDTHYAIAWRTYLNHTARFVHASRLSECFGGVLLPEGVEFLRNSQRVGGNIRSLIREHFGLPLLPDDLALEPADLRLLLMPVDDVANFELRLGAVFLANSLAQMIQSAAVNRLREVLGQDIYTVALANRHLAISAEPITDPDVLLAAMREDGHACLASWCQSMPAYIGKWHSLKYPSTAQMQPAYEGDAGDRAVSIVRHLSDAVPSMAGA